MEASKDEYLKMTEDEPPVLNKLKIHCKTIVFLATIGAIVLAIVLFYYYIPFVVCRAFEGNVPGMRIFDSPPEKYRTCEYCTRGLCILLTPFLIFGPIALVTCYKSTYNQYKRQEMEKMGIEIKSLNKF